MKFFETSAKKNLNIDELMQYMMEAVYNKIFIDPEDRGTSIVISKQKPGEKGRGSGANNNTTCCS
jgi:hypothetical protein